MSEETDVVESLKQIVELRQQFDSQLKIATATGETKQAEQLKSKIEQKIEGLEREISPFELYLREKLAGKLNLRFVDEFTPEGLARALDSEGYSIFIDRSGKQVGKRYPYAQQFSCGFALTVDSSAAIINDHGPVSPVGKLHYNFMDVHGEEMCLFSWNSARSFMEGYASVQSDKRGQWFYIDTGGAIATHLGKHTEADPFSDGVAWVKIDKVSSGYSYRLIDTTGKRVIDRIVFSKVTPFSEGLSAVEHNGIWSYYDKTGNRSFPYTFKGALPFSEGLAVTFTPSTRGEDLYTFIKKGGNLFSYITFEQAKSFKHGLAPVKEGGLWRFINKSWEQAFEGEYDEAESYFGGVARVRKGDIWFYIDTRGKRVFK